MGLGIGTVDAGATVELRYEATVSKARDISLEAFASTISTREAVLPVKANTGKQPGLTELATRIKAVDGVSSAEQLSFVDLPRGSLSASVPVKGQVRLFGFDSSYTAQDPNIAIVEGTQVPGEVLISAESARSLSVGIHDPISLTLPDGTRLERRISGIVDLTRARALFLSRMGENLELFVYVPDSVVVDAATFTDIVVPAFERVNTGRGDRVKMLPVREVDIHVRRDLLEAEPVAALEQTERIAAAVVGATEDHRGRRVEDRGVNEQSFLLDNVSNTLAVARDDAAVAKRMFLFLSIPGAMLAALLGAYAGIVLAGAQRREQATLRVRGATRRNLLWMLWLRVGWITAGGAAIGLVLGYTSVAAVLGRNMLERVTTESLAFSGVLGTIFGLMATGAALYWTGRSTIDRGIQMDRLGPSTEPPLWQRYRLDLLGLAALVVATAIAISNSGFEGTPGSVYEGRAVELSLGLLLLPIAAWVAASLFGGRLFAWLLSHLSTRAPQGAMSPLSLLYWRSLKRRSWSLVVATLILGMIVALATSLAVFTASYDAAKVADARYTVGSDLKIIPRPASKQTYKSDDASKLAVEGVEKVVPVIYGVHNVQLRSYRTTDVANLAALDPKAYGEVAPFDDAHFSLESADESMDAIAVEPNAILLSEDIAEFMKVDEGDTVWVLLGRATAEQVEIEMKVRGLYERLPGFPDGADALMNLERYQKAIPSAVPAFFFGQTSDSSDTQLEEVTEALHSGPGAGDALRLDTRLTALGKDQSSLASLNINGLLRLDSAYSLAMGTVTVAIFVFGLLLQRRREYVTLRAQGMSPRAIQTFIGAEAGTAAVMGCSLGVVVGLLMAYYFINVLRPLFVLKPEYVVPVASLTAILGSVLAATVVTSMAASALVNQLQAMELLRDE
jgi:putative ABC transport system permease protein